MNIFNTVFFYQLKRSLRKVEITIFLIITVLAIFFIQYGKTKYLNTCENIEIFQKSENARVSQYVMYRQYGAFGSKAKYVPSPHCTLYNDCLIDGLTTSVNTAEKLDIYKPVKGNSFFIARSGYMTFLGFMLIFGFLLGLLYGYQSTKNKEYLKLFSNITGSQSKKLFWSLIFSRLIILNIAFLLIVAISFLSLLLSGINLFQWPFAAIALVIFLVISFSFALGAVIGSIKNPVRPYILGVVYFLSIVFIPFLAEMGNEANGASIESVLEFELDNLKTIMAVDKKLIDQYGSLKSNEPAPPEFIKAVKEAVKKEHGIIMDRENRLKNEMLNKINQDQALSALFPVLLYISTSKEISSQGGLSLVDFYSYCQQLKIDFINFYVNHRFPEDGTNSPDHIGRVENFIKDKENLFYAQSKLPGSFTLGVLVTLFYIIILFIITFRMNVKYIHPGKSLDKPDIDFEKENSLFAYCKNPQVKEDLFTSFKNDGQSICIDRFKIDPIEGPTNARSFFKYLCQLAGANEEKVKNYLSRINGDLNQRLSPDLLQKIYFCIKCSKEGLLYVFNDFFKNKSLEFERDFLPVLEQLHSEGKILYLGVEFYNVINVLSNIKIDRFNLYKIHWGKNTLR